MGGLPVCFCERYYTLFTSLTGGVRWHHFSRLTSRFVSSAKCLNFLFVLRPMYKPIAAISRPMIESQSPSISNIFCSFLVKSSVEFRFTHAMGLRYQMSFDLLVNGNTETNRQRNCINAKGKWNKASR